jgi:hypothetical protein
MNTRAWLVALIVATVVNGTWLAVNAAHSVAAGTMHYKVVRVAPLNIEAVLNQQTGEGWEYVGSIMDSLIFKQ